MPQGYDLIWRGVEITTGAQREHRYEILKKQAEEKGLGKDVEFYLEFFRYGCPPHGGFGLGVDRLTMLLVGLSIKECMFLFRGPNRLNPVTGAGGERLAKPSVLCYYKQSESRKNAMTEKVDAVRLAQREAPPAARAPGGSGTEVRS